MKAEDRVRKTIEDNGLIHSKDTVVLALSGGPDSLCLLHILMELRGSLDFQLKALHVNHMLRGADADADELWVKDHCEKLEIPVKTVRCDIAAMAREQGLSEEEAGRQVRYRALEQYAQGSLIALAHNSGDQAETVLFRLIRGTGIHGLGAMEYKRKDGIIRPLLDTPRSEIEEYCSRKGLSPRLDKTNAQADYTRNRLRLQLIPLLEQDYNPAVTAALVRLAASARADDAYLERAAQEGLKGLGFDPEKAQSTGSASLSAKGLLSLDPALRTRAIESILKSLGLCEDLSAVHRQSLERALSSEKGMLTIELPKGFRSLIKGGNMYFYAPGAYEKEKMKGPAALPVLCTTEFAAEKAPSISSLAAGQKLVDKEKLMSLKEPLQIRFRQAGDVITPLGMKGTKKLKDHFTDRKIPKEERDRIPLLCSGKTVLWIAGYDLNDIICVDKNTKFSLLLEMKYTL